MSITHILCSPKKLEFRLTEHTFSSTSGTICGDQNCFFSIKENFPCLSHGTWDSLPFYSLCPKMVTCRRLTQGIILCAVILYVTSFWRNSTSTSAPSVYDFTVVDMEGKDVPLSHYQGKVLLITNVASFCGLTDCMSCPLQFGNFNFCQLVTNNMRPYTLVTESEDLKF